MLLGKDCHLPKSNCTNCGAETDGATCVADDRFPSPGDFTICISCGHLMCFTEQLGLREPTDEELVAIAGDDRLILASAMLGAITKKPEKQG